VSCHLQLLTLQLAWRHCSGSSSNKQAAQNKAADEADTQAAELGRCGETTACALAVVYITFRSIMAYTRGAAGGCQHGLKHHVVETSATPDERHPAGCCEQRPIHSSAAAAANNQHSCCCRTLCLLCMLTQPTLAYTPSLARTSNLTCCQPCHCRRCWPCPG
jgi:hypothetical protein